MKKKITLSICLLCTLLVFSACSKEGKGVPESVVLRDTSFSIDESTKYTIKHNIDTESHIDDAELEIHYEGSCGTNIINIPYSYQYDKSNDTWTLIQEHDEMRKYSINEKSYINSSPWTGTATYPHDCSYSITFQELDMESCTATVSYKIDFDDNEIADLSEHTTVNIDNMYGMYAPFFKIEYETAGLWSNKELQFFLTIEGLKHSSEYN